VLLRGLADVIDRYDAVLLDQFGVLHDGVSALPGTISVVEKLRQSGKPIIIVSNTSKRKSFVVNLLEKLGFGEVDDIACSGEMSYNFISENFAGKKCCWLTWSDEKRANECWMNGLQVSLSSALNADFVLLHGTETIVTSSIESGLPISMFLSGKCDHDLLDVLNKTIERNITVVCANQDYTAMQATGRAYMPGMILKEYITMGGNNYISFGKPNKDFFVHAVELARASYSKKKESFSGSSTVFNKTRPFRVLHIGDSLHHDIAGAHSAGIDSLMITKHGVHRTELNEISTNILNQHISQSLSNSIDILSSKNCYNIPTDTLNARQTLIKAVMELCDSAEIRRPSYILEELVW
jgi:HAD superfamily hydrolase (TIGR01459 family)